jgi:hypothetical protein
VVTEHIASCPAPDQTALGRRQLTIFSALLTRLTAVPVAEADNASTEPAVSQTHLAEASLPSGATLTIERRGPVALFQTEEPRWPTKQPR